MYMTTLPLNGLVEVAAFQELFGRLFGCGDEVLLIIGGGGVAELSRLLSVQPIGSFYEVERKLEDVGDLCKLKDAIVTLKDSYVETRYLEAHEGELKCIREAVKEKEKPPWTRKKEEKQYVA